MKNLKFICYGLFLMIAGCQSPQVQLEQSLTQSVNPASISSSSTTLAKIKADPNSFFPTEQGFTWQYDVVFHPTDDPYVDYKGNYTVSVDKALKKSSTETVINLRAIDTISQEYNFPVITMDKNNISIKGVNYFGFGSEKIDDLTIDFLHLPLKKGDKWDDGQWIGKTMTQEKVTIPSGTYDAWKIDVIGTYDHAYTAVGSYWVTPGIGIVKSDLSVPGWSVETVLVSAAKKK